jgi:hypothetical protein
LLDFWPKVGTINTASFADRLYKLSCPFCEKVCVETDVSFCTSSQLHLITLNVLMTFGMTCATVTLSFIFQRVNIFLISVVLYFLCCALM